MMQEDITRKYMFTSILNLRDLGESISGNKGTMILHRVLYRSATLDVGTTEELNMLVADLQLKTILDLRSEMEAKITRGKAFTLFPVNTTSISLKPSDVLNPDPEPDIDRPKVTMSRRASISGTIRRKLSLSGGIVNCGPRKTIMINFIGPKFRKHAVLWPAPFWCKLKMAGLVLSGQKMEAARLAGVEVMNKKRLEGLYRDFVDYCDQEINEALHVLADASNYPLLVHCTHGKDRTGLVIALALAAVGVDEEQIFQDYAKSTEGLRPIHKKMIDELQTNGLDACFCETPYQTMKDTFAYIKEKYRTVERYLNKIGFGEHPRQRLSHILVDNSASLHVHNSMKSHFFSMLHPVSHPNDILHTISGSSDAILHHHHHKPDDHNHLPAVME